MDKIFTAAMAAVLVSFFGCSSDMIAPASSDATTGAADAKATAAIEQPPGCDIVKNGSDCVDWIISVDGQCHRSVKCQRKADVDGSPIDKCVVTDNGQVGTACDDSNKCTTGDQCANVGACVGKSVDCDDKNACTTDSCDKAKGCLHGTVDTACSDGDACTSGDKCLGGACAGAKIDCDDKNACTSDSCDPAKGCVNAHNANACTDDNVCTEGDVCKDGACAAGAAKNCDDGKQCVDDACDPIKGCAHVNAKVGAACDDGIVKTVGDICDGGGKCIGKTATACAANADCAGLEVNKCASYVCDIGLGLCKPQPAALTDDGNPCTLEVCNPVDGSTLHTALDVSCDDKNVCTVGDLCKKGVCTAGGATMPCDDNNACTTDSCDNIVGGCVHATLACDDKNPYTDDSCEPKWGCQFVAKQATVACEVPKDFMVGFVFTDCSVETKFGKADAATGAKTFANPMVGKVVKLSLEQLCAALAGGAVLVVKATAYMSDGTPISGGGELSSVSMPDGSKVEGSFQAWSGTEAERIVGKADIGTFCPPLK